ncbi:hypothetical protein IE077_001935 [Cardiosporidium cionae]|uniref:Uracil-DNA glycosylase-like domain-containing protein n=1 Tax=Cardiosporidium cionae TaxID=476202 RepID=A0ABQ7J4V1_9APIC|nr:hypothetical protein IE077_001935 [Cardiosporidium cionae]|eukprot:KAF8819007.1 hypothetical protein IE077_001935 [Cardiosporidium cionae]
MRRQTNYCKPVVEIMHHSGKRKRATAQSSLEDFFKKASHSAKNACSSSDACCINEEQLEDYSGLENSGVSITKFNESPYLLFAAVTGSSYPSKNRNISINSNGLSGAQSFAEDDLKKWSYFLGDEFEALRNELKKHYIQHCLSIVKRDRQTKKVYPPEHLVFNAFKLTPLGKVKVVIVGQDPYHQPGQAMGLCFSVPRGISCPPSLKNILKEIGCTSNHGDLTSWGEQGVFLLNSLLTVVDSRPMSHKDLGWERFTDGVIDIINSRCENTRLSQVFKTDHHPIDQHSKPAQKKAARVNRKKHHVLEAGHPSPLSVRFFQASLMVACCYSAKSVTHWRNNCTLSFPIGLNQAFSCSEVFKPFKIWDAILIRKTLGCLEFFVVLFPYGLRGCTVTFLTPISAKQERGSLALFVDVNVVSIFKNVMNCCMPLDGISSSGSFHHKNDIFSAGQKSEISICPNIADFLL